MGSAAARERGKIPLQIGVGVIQHGKRQRHAAGERRLARRRTLRQRIKCRNGAQNAGALQDFHCASRPPTVDTGPKSQHDN